MTKQVSHDPSEFLLEFFGAQETVPNIINVEKVVLFKRFC